MGVRKSATLLLISAFVILPHGISSWDWRNPGKNWFEDPLFQKPLDLTSLDTQSLGAAFFFRINELRFLHGLAPVSYSPALEIAAVGWAKTLADRSLLVQDKELSTRIRNAGASGGTYGELIALTGHYPGVTVLQAARDLAEVLYSSPEHRNLLLGPRAGDAAAGVSVKIQGGFLEIRGVFTFLWGQESVPGGGTAVQEKPQAPASQNPGSPKGEIPVLNWGAPVSSLRNPRFFGSWTGGREAFRIDFSLGTLLGAERPQWILAVTRPRTEDFSALFIKITGRKAPGLLARFRESYGEPSLTLNAPVDGDTESAKVHVWQGPSSELRLYEGETHTYVRLSER